MSFKMGRCDIAKFATYNQINDVRTKKHIVRFAKFDFYI